MSFAYDDAYDPPAPVVPIRVVDPGESAGVLVRGLIDTGADCTLIPTALASSLRLPAVGQLEIIGMGGGGGNASVYAARVEIAGTSFLARLVAFENEVIVGRDVLNRVVALLDGPRLQVRLIARKQRALR